MELPEPVAVLADALITAAGVEAVVLGGSRASGEEGPLSDWDLGVYYRPPLDLGPAAAWGEVHGPGSWGRLMNGGAWLDLDGLRVDVLLREVAVVEHWTAEAAEGRFEVDALLGYVAGLPTYSLAAELAFAVPLRGVGPPPLEFPEALAASAPVRWRYCRDFSLSYAEKHAANGSVVGAVGQVARAVLEEGHARRCERRQWVLNEKRLLSGCGLEAASDRLAAPGSSPDDLLTLVTEVRRALQGSARSGP